MKITLIISEAARVNPGDSRIGRLAGTLSKPSALVVGMGILFRRTGLTVPVLHGKLGALLAQTASLDLELAAATMLMAYAGGAYLMSLKEKIMKPLMEAQYEKGLEKGAADASAKHEAWKARQRALGVIFVPDPEDGTEGGPERPASEK